jgi:magnesium transporter
MDLPFELQCVDSCLYIVSEILTDETTELQEATKSYIQMILKGSTNNDPSTIIRAVKNAVQMMTSRVKGFTQSITRVLNEDEDMALMNLSRLLTHPERYIQPVSPEVLEEESDEPELILEAHLQIALTLMNSLDLVQSQINTASELIDQKVNSIQNKLLLANMVISVLFFCCTCISVIPAFFGMNLMSHMEEDPHAFKRVSIGALVGGFLLGVAIMFILFRSGVIPRV